MRQMLTLAQYYAGIKAGVAYFALVFGLGSIRVPFYLPSRRRPPVPATPALRFIVKV